MTANPRASAACQDPAGDRRLCPQPGRGVCAHVEGRAGHRAREGCFVNRGRTGVSGPFLSLTHPPTTAPTLLRSGTQGARLSACSPGGTRASPPLFLSRHAHARKSTPRTYTHTACTHHVPHAQACTHTHMHAHVHHTRTLRTPPTRIPCTIPTPDWLNHPTSVPSRAGPSEPRARR